MEERMGEAFAGTEELTVTGKRLQAGEAAPDFCLNYLGLADLAVRTVGLADSAVMVCLLNVVNSLERPLCQLVTRRWEACCPALPPIAYIYTVSMDSPEMQARWQDSAGVLHQALSAHHSEGINPWLPCKGARHYVIYKPLSMWNTRSRNMRYDAEEMFEMSSLEETVLTWLYAHPGREIACRWQSEKHFVALAFERLRQAAIQGKVVYETLSEVFVYLRASLNGAILETLRISS